MLCKQPVSASHFPLKCVVCNSLSCRSPSAEERINRAHRPYSGIFILGRNLNICPQQGFSHFTEQATMEVGLLCLAVMNVDVRCRGSNSDPAHTRIRQRAKPWKFAHLRRHQVLHYQNL